MKLNEINTSVPVLENHKKHLKETRIDFDPNDISHREDFLALETGKLAEKRYNLRSKNYRKQVIYADVLTMMKTEIALWACEDIMGTAEEFETFMDNFPQIENN